MKIEKLDIGVLIPYASNSRTHSDEQVAKIAASINEFGFNNPVLIGDDNTIIAGHGRVMAARKLGIESIPCVRLSHLTPAQRKAYIIADNRLALDAGWDKEMLSAEFSALKELDFDVTMTGFSDDEIDDLLADKKIGLVDDDSVPEIHKETIVKPGDIWILGNHRLMCGSATSIDDMRKLCIQDVDIWLTDPPYNVAYTGGTNAKLKIKNDDMDDESFLKFLSDSYSAADSVMKSGAVFYIWHADSEGFNFRYAAKITGWKIRQCLVWKKSSLVIGRQDYQWKHEPCLYGWKEGASHLWASDRKQTTILEFDKPSRSLDHPTMKPVELFEYQLLNNTKGGDIVLDSFCGSGTTIIAAEKNGRKCFAMELDPVYCDVIIRRWQDFSGGKAIHSETGCEFEVKHGTP